MDGRIHLIAKCSHACLSSDVAVCELERDFHSALVLRHELLDIVLLLGQSIAHCLCEGLRLLLNHLAQVCECLVLRLHRRIEIVDIGLCRFQLGLLFAEFLLKVSRLLLRSSRLCLDCLELRLHVFHACI